MIGGIHAPEAYALGKMLDHSGWALPRGITPCDFDVVFDNNGRIIFCELSSSIAAWEDVSVGQRWAYQSAIRKGNHCAALCKHDVKPGDCKQINTRFDICLFQVMIYELQSFRVSRVIDGNNHWQAFVFGWFANPDGLRAEVISRSTVL